MKIFHLQAISLMSVILTLSACDQSESGLDHIGIIKDIQQIRELNEEIEQLRESLVQWNSDRHWLEDRKKQKTSHYSTEGFGFGPEEKEIVSFDGTNQILVKLVFAIIESKRLEKETSPKPDATNLVRDLILNSESAFQFDSIIVMASTDPGASNVPEDISYAHSTWHLFPKSEVTDFENRPRPEDQIYPSLADSIFRPHDIGIFTPGQLFQFSASQIPGSEKMEFHIRFESSILKEPRSETFSLYPEKGKFEPTFPVSPEPADFKYSGDVHLVPNIWTLITTSPLAFPEQHTAVLCLHIETPEK